MRCAYFYTSGMIINFNPILQGVSLVHIEKFKIFFDIFWYFDIIWYYFDILILFDILNLK